MGKFERAALDIEVRLLVLAHAEQLFGGVRLEAGRQLVIAAQDGVELAGVHAQGTDQCLQVSRLLLRGACGSPWFGVCAAKCLLCLAAVAVEFFQQDIAALVEEDDFAGVRSAWQ